MAEVVLDSDDDDDIFIQGGGAGAAVSFYSAKNLDDDDDDLDLDDDDDESTIVPVQPRGPRSRLNQGLHRKKSAPVVAIPDDDNKPPEEATVTKKSVFDADSEDDVEVIPQVADARDFEGQLAQLRAMQAIESAKMLLDKGDEQKIERDAMEYAKRVSAENAKRERSRDLLAREKQARASPAHLPRPPSGGSVAGTSGPLNGNEASGATGDGDDESGDPILLRVRNGDNSIKVKFLTTHPLLRILPPFCIRFNIDLAKAVMEVDGETVEEADTAQTYELENNNIVDIRVRK